MISRGHVSKHQLQFESEIEKVAQKNKVKKRKVEQCKVKEES